MNERTDGVDERAARYQMKVFLFTAVGAVGLGYVLVTPTSILMAVPYLLVAYGLFRWSKTPPADGSDRQAVQRDTCAECGSPVAVGRERCASCAEGTDRFRK